MEDDNKAEFHDQLVTVDEVVIKNIWDRKWSDEACKLFQALALWTEIGSWAKTTLSKDAPRLASIWHQNKLV